jgi:hypothetical protein
MYKHNNICFSGILQLIESGNVNGACTCSASELFCVMEECSKKKNSADAESQLEVYILFRFLVPVHSWLTAALVLIISLVLILIIALLLIIVFLG